MEEDIAYEIYGILPILMHLAQILCFFVEWETLILLPHCSQM
jgi:hypothetical protein